MNKKTNPSNQIYAEIINLETINFEKEEAKYLIEDLRRVFTVYFNNLLICNKDRVKGLYIRSLLQYRAQYILTKTENKNLYSLVNLMDIRSIKKNDLILKNNEGLWYYRTNKDKNIYNKIGIGNKMWLVREKTNI